MQQVAEGKADISASPFILNFLMKKGLGPYAGLGKKKGAELADNLRLLYSYDIAMFFLVAFESKGIDSWEKLRGKTIFNADKSLPLSLPSPGKTIFRFGICFVSLTPEESCFFPGLNPSYCSDSA